MWRKNDKYDACARLQLNTEYEPANKWQIKVDLKTENLVLGWVPTASKADGRRSQFTEKHVALYLDQSLICVLCNTLHRSRAQALERRRDCITQLHSEREALHSRRCQNEAKSLDILRLKSQIVHFSYVVAVSQ